MSSDHDLFLSIAHTVGVHKGTCARRNVGAVLVANGRLREIGWNGQERADDLPNCLQGACPRGSLTDEEQPHGVGYSNCIYFHAEYNAGENFRHAQGARNVEGWATVLNVVIYSSSTPCEECKVYATRAGIILIWNGMGCEEDISPKGIKEVPPGKDHLVQSQLAERVGCSARPYRPQGQAPVEG